MEGLQLRIMILEKESWMLLEIKLIQFNDLR